MRDSSSGRTIAYPDTVFGTDSHTTMVNGLGVVGWGVGGIEAEAAMLGQPSSMLIPPVLGYRLTGRLPEGTTATDLVLFITEALRKRGCVGKFVEFYGSGLRHLTIADRVTLGNMCPEYGATVAIFPIDNMTLDYLRLTGREPQHSSLSKRMRSRRALPHRRHGGPGVQRNDGTRSVNGRTEPRGPTPTARPRAVDQSESVVCHRTARVEERSQGRDRRRQRGRRDARRPCIMERWSSPRSRVARIPRIRV